MFQTSTVQSWTTFSNNHFDEKPIRIPHCSAHVCSLHSPDDLRPFGEHANNPGRLAATLHEELHVPLPEQHGC